MSKFSVESIEALEYDFTGIPRADGQGKCSGSGVVQEPSHGDLKRYRERMKKVTTATLRLAPDKQPDNIAEMRELILKDEELEKRGGAPDFFAELFEATVDLCKDSPSRQELEELPARHRDGFCLWLMRELSDPNSLGPAGTSQTTNNGLTTPSGATSG